MRSGPLISNDQWADWRWRVRNLYTITDKQGKVIPFHPNDVQEQLYQNLHSRVVVLKARQRGITTAAAIAMLDDCLWNPDIRAAVIAHKLDDSKVIFRDRVKGVYDRLPDALKEKLPLRADSTDTLTFKNGSSMRVSTSTRSGTLQWLHVSEYARLSAAYPDRAKEVLTGAFPSVSADGIIIVESTAEGSDGPFHDICKAAQSLPDDTALDRLSWKFMFFPWFTADEYELPQTTVPSSPEDEEYFDGLERSLGVEISRPKRNWWLAQEAILGPDIYREFPASPEEAFKAALEGAYFAASLATAQKHGRIGDYPIDPGLPVNTCWDLGRGDSTVIWLWQDRRQQPTFIGVYANSGEWIAHYIDWLVAWQKKHGVQFGRHYLPHDGDIKNVWIPDGSLEVMANLGFRPDIVKRSPNKIETINTARRKMAMCAFDRDGCKVGLEQLGRYRKDWDEKFGVWRDRPRHDEASHYADAFLTFSESGHIPLPPLISGKRERYRGKDTTSEGSWMAA
jgi:hypothetical protein